MKSALVIFMAIILLAGIAMAYDDPELVRPRDELLLQESLNNLLNVGSETGTIKTWVFFTDKGFSSYDDYNVKLNEAEQLLDEKCRSRRLKARGRYNLVDFYDIPVYQPYIDQVKESGVKIRRVLKWFNAVTIEANAAQLIKIAQLPSVHSFKSVVCKTGPIDDTEETQGDIESSLITNTLEYGFSETQIEQMNAVVAHELGYAGQDVLICMMDTGYRQEHTAFANIISEGRLIDQYDFLHNDNNTDYDPEQDQENQISHGTKTWSTLGGESSGNLYGPAYLANFVLAKTENPNSEYHSEEDNWVAAAEWCDSLGVDIISASLGYRYRFDPPDEDYPYEMMNGDSTIVAIAADIAASKGITIATAQGNDGSAGEGSLISPADADSVIAVGAVQESDELAGFSGIGPTYDGRIKPEVCAHGQSTACADPYDLNAFTFTSGTSLSTPLVGGACGVLLAMHPNWTPMMVREALMMTACNINDPGTPDNYYGWGIVDLGKAMFYNPDGDIVFDHEPITFFPSGLDNGIVNVSISGGAGIASTYLYLRYNGQDDFQRSTMDLVSGDMYEGIIGGVDEGYFQYYFAAEDYDGVTAVYPYGSPDNYFTVYIDTTRFEDSFENGLYCWETGGTNGGWSLTAERASTGNISITDSPYRNYVNNAEYTLTGKFTIPLYTAESASVSFQARHIIQTNHDYLYFEVSDDDGENWELLGDVISGTQLGFQEVAMDLADYLGEAVMFRFRLITDGEGLRDGIHIDDFVVDWDLRTDITERDQALPRQFNLAQNYPNPFNPSTVVGFELPHTSDVELTIYDILGKKVKTLAAGMLEAGPHEVIWNATDEYGNDVASGMYFYKITADNYSDIKRMMLIR